MSNEEPGQAPPLPEEGEYSEHPDDRSGNDGDQPDARIDELLETLTSSGMDQLAGDAFGEKLDNIVKIQDAIRRSLENQRIGSNFNILTFDKIGALVLDSKGGVRVASAAGTSDGGSGSEKKLWGFAKYELTSGDLPESQLMDLAYVLALSVLSGSSQSQIGAAADKLAASLQKNYFSNTEPTRVDVVTSRLTLHQQLDCVITQQTASSFSTPVEIVKFASEGTETALLLSAWRGLNLSRPWRPVFIEWLRALGHSSDVTVRAAAGRAAGTLAALDYEHTEQTLLNYWQDKTSLDALGFAYLVLRSSHEAHREAIDDRLLSWARGERGPRYSQRAGLLAVGPLVQFEPELALRIAAKLARQATWFTTGLARYVYCVLFVSGLHEPTTTAIMLTEVERLRLDKSDRRFQRIGDVLFLSMTQIRESDDEQSASRLFLDVLTLADDAVAPAARLLNLAISPNPRASWAVARLRALAEASAATGDEASRRTFRSLCSAMLEHGDEFAREALTYWLSEWQQERSLKQAELAAK